MKDENYWPVLGTWLKDTATTPPEPQQTARRVAERLPQTPQVRRRWWLPSLRRTSHRSTPIPTANGHVPTPIGRTQTMFSPVKAVTAGALVFAIGGAFLIAQPFGEQQTGVPSAGTDTVPVITADELLVASRAASGEHEWPIIASPAFSAADAVEARFDPNELSEFPGETGLAMAEAFSDDVVAELAPLGLMPEDVSFYVWALQAEPTGGQSVVNLLVLRLAGADADPDALLAWLAEARMHRQFESFEGLSSLPSFKAMEPTEIGGRPAYRTDGSRGLDTFVYLVGDTVVAYADAGGSAPLSQDEWTETAAAFVSALPTD